MTDSAGLGSDCFFSPLLHTVTRSSARSVVELKAQYLSFKRSGVKVMYLKNVNVLFLL